MGPKFLKSNFSPRTHAPWNQFSREAHASNNCDRSNLSHDPPSFWAAPLIYDLSSDHLILNSADFSVSATELNREFSKTSAEEMQILAQIYGSCNKIWVVDSCNTPTDRLLIYKHSAFPASVIEQLAVN